MYVFAPPEYGRACDSTAPGGQVSKRLCTKDLCGQSPLRFPLIQAVLPFCVLILAGAVLAFRSEGYNKPGARVL